MQQAKGIPGDLVPHQLTIKMIVSKEEETFGPGEPDKLACGAKMVPIHSTQER